MNPNDIRRHELSNFLRTRRERISPSELGLPASGRRRTPGLRREEVAQLAGMSATWYTWLEQSRPISVSAQMLDNLARVLRLNPIERVQLFQLGLRQPIIDSTPRVEEISPLLCRMLDQMEGFPAFVMGRRWDVLAWNIGARAFLADFAAVEPSERNLVWLIFTDPKLRSLLIDWRTRARDVLARFRADYGRHAGDAHFVQLVERLKSVSAEFAEWWPRHDVLPQSEGLKRYAHPRVGRLELEHVTLSVSDNPELRLTLFAPVQPSDSAAKLQRIINSFKVPDSMAKHEPVHARRNAHVETNNPNP
ncbi:MAG TPA: helix-turn-helix transcriptional regulator [Candidatus Binataceae bacterium]|nr:helix-turn-helix transcriptional regulator [Candidatus Binataceae bacterium]